MFQVDFGDNPQAPGRIGQPYDTKSRPDWRPQRAKGNEIGVETASLLGSNSSNVRVLLRLGPTPPLL